MEKQFVGAYVPGELYTLLVLRAKQQFATQTAIICQALAAYLDYAIPLTLPENKTAVQSDPPMEATHG